MLTSVWREFPPTHSWDSSVNLQAAAAGLRHKDVSLLLWKEQGLGDELLLTSVFPDAVRDLCAVGGGRVVLEASTKLMPLFLRSFTTGVHGCGTEVEIVRYPMGEQHHHTGTRTRSNPGPRREELGRLWGAAVPTRLSLPIGGLPAVYRRRISQFPTSKEGHLRADPVRVMHWRTRLQEEAAAREGLEQRSTFAAVGIAWRSSITTPGRASFYAKPADLAPLFQLEHVLIYNLQYDLTASEFEEIAMMFGQRALITFPNTELDLYNDLDEVAAFMSALDVVISPLISTADLAGALGVPTWVFSPTHAHDRFLGSQGMPWYPSVRVFAKRMWEEPWSSLFKRMALPVMTLTN